MNPFVRSLQTLLLAGAVLAGLAALAQEDVLPAVASDPGGTTIVGERDTAVGLFVAPWQEPSASVLDTAPGPYDVPMQPVEIERFRRLADYDRVSRDYERERWLDGR
ncbi:hypothetical protein [Sinimarinibacterium thermocellulolyticum]|uniref:Uncharacterized protein n=1 Tax=Sinimarinibacterium thermocellulolyticum TaxID=3170016 RepID=A0ABV2ACP8_9GAMM